MGAATLKAPLPGPHDPRQDAEWALQLALYEASIHPRSTGPLRLESHPTQVILKEIPLGAARKELEAMFSKGTVGEVDYQLGSEAGVPGEWHGTSLVTFSNLTDRDAAFNALSRFVRVY